MGSEVTRPTQECHGPCVKLVFRNLSFTVETGRVGLVPDQTEE